MSNNAVELSEFIQELVNRHMGKKFRSLGSVTRSRNKTRRKRFLRKFTWDANDNMFNLNKIMNENEKIFLGVSDVDDLITSEIVKLRAEANVSTLFRETSVLCNRETWQSWAEDMYPSTEYLIVQSNSSGGFIVEIETNNLLKFDVNSNTVTVRAFGDADFCEETVKVVETQFDVVTSHIEWVYGSQGESVDVPLNRDRLPVAEMYPFLKGESLEDYYDRYMESSANILLLIGPPGTGKTTFIRGLLAHRNASAIVTYDAGILEKDSFFAKFIEDDSEVMVLEDSDAFLKSRSDGNTMMHRFLNVGDGLVTTKGKKMVFSTNLPSIRDIDSALVRPGRCFDIVTFDALDLVSAQNLAKKLDVTLPVKPRGKETEPYSIAEIFNKKTEGMSTATNKKMGFM